MCWIVTHRPGHAAVRMARWRPCPMPSASRTSRPRVSRRTRRPRPARRRAGDRRCPRTPRISSSRPAVTAARVRTALAAIDDDGAAHEADEDARASTRSAPARRRVRGRRRAPGLAAGRPCGLRRRRRVGGGDRGGRRRPSDAARGLLRHGRGRPPRRRRDAVTAPPSRPARLGARRGPPEGALPGAGAVVAHGRRRRRRESPYRALIRESARGAGRPATPPSRPTTGSGSGAGDVERWSTGTLEAWQDAVTEPARARGEPPIEPWDWWWRAGRRNASWRAPPARARLRRQPRVLRVARRRPRCAQRPPRHHAACRAPARPGGLHDLRRATPASRDGTWSPGEPRCSSHTSTAASSTSRSCSTRRGTRSTSPRSGRDRRSPTGRTRTGSPRPSRSWSRYDAAEPAWQRRWLPGRPEVPVATSIRCLVRLGGPRRRLGAVRGPDADRPFAPPERGVDRDHVDVAGDRAAPRVVVVGDARAAVQEAGYMGNYAVGAVVATALRAAIRRARGDWPLATPAGTRGSPTRSTASGRSVGAGAIRYVFPYLTGSVPYCSPAPRSSPKR